MPAPPIRAAVTATIKQLEAAGGDPRIGSDRRRRVLGDLLEQIEFLEQVLRRLLDGLTRSALRALDNQRALARRSLDLDTRFKRVRDAEPPNSVVVGRPGILELVDSEVWSHLANHTDQTIEIRHRGVTERIDTS